MDPAAASITGMRTIQGALSIMAALQLTGYLWPQQALVQDGAMYDYIVVGAGSAGSVVAGRLSEDPNNNVLLIEAGGDAPLESSLPLALLWMQRSRVDWNYTTKSDEEYRKCHQKSNFQINQGKMLGGTGSLNYMIYAKGKPNDYNTWAKMVNDDTWSWENVAPYFKKLEKYNDPEYQTGDNIHHGTEGKINIEQFRRLEGRYLKAFQENGYFVGNLNEENVMGYSPMMLLIADGIRQSSARAYLTPVKDHDNLAVLKNTMVTKILFDDSRNAIGVKALTPDGKLATYKAKKEVIICAGVFNTPKLLLLSGIGPKDHLKSHNIEVLSDLPVGQNLRDHVSITVIFNLEKLERPLPPRNPREFPPEAAYTGLAALDVKSTVPDYIVDSFVTDRERILRFCSFCYQYSNEICNKIYESGEGRLQSVNQFFGLKQYFQGQVLLQSTNPEDPPIIENNLSDDKEFPKLFDYVQDYVKIINSSYFKSIEAEIPSIGKCDEFSRSSPDYWGCLSSCMKYNAGNYGGTVRMGSVVDSRLRVLGVNQLRVADASVMPTLVSGRTYAPVMMIAEKLVDFIKNDE